MIRHAMNTEKGIRAMEAANKLVFIVDGKDSKTDIKKNVEELFNVKVIGVQTMRSLQGKKKAIVTLSAETPAMDVATKVGMM